MALESLSDIFSVNFINNRYKAYFLTFFIQICINCLNIFLKKGRATCTRIAIESQAMSEADLYTKIEKIGDRKILFLIKAPNRILTSSLLIVLTCKNLQYSFQ